MPHALAVTPLESLAVLAAGTAAGAINAVVGSGGLITFSTLLAVGCTPVTANVTSNIGLVPGSLSGAVGYRRELAGQSDRVRALAAGSVSGAVVGSGLLLRLPPAVFDAVVPAFVIGACALIALQPRLSRWIAGRRPHDAPEVGTAAILATFATGVYGGYFGAAQGVIILAVLGIFVPDDLHRSNAAKNVLAVLVNATAAAVFAVFADVAWAAALLVAVGAVAGGGIGARYGRRLTPRTLRYLVITVGLLVAAHLITQYL